MRGGSVAATPHEPMMDNIVLWHLHLGNMIETDMLKLHASGLLPRLRS